MTSRARRHTLVVTFVVALWAVATLAAHAQFGVNLQPQWTTFHDPSGRFSIKTPPGWTYQAGQSTDGFAVFYGPGNYDLFYVEILPPAPGTTTPAEQAQAAITRYSGLGGLADFRLITPPTTGRLADRETSFIVYAYTDGQGTPMVEGRAFLFHGGDVLTLAFADIAANFDANVPTFNAIMESLTLSPEPVTRPATQPGAGFGILPGSPTPGTAPSTTPVIPSVPTTPQNDAVGYLSPGGLYRFTPPADWELWEEQASSRGDTVEDWNGVFRWRGKPMAKSLFIWDYFDEWEQKGAQYEIVLGVIERVPEPLDRALEQLKDLVTGDTRMIYTVETSRARIGAQPGVKASIVTRPGMVELWSAGPQWHKDVTFYAFKQGTNLFLWVVPNEVADHEAVTAAMASFEWLGGQ